ncbi:MAG: hypothetical protein GX087_12450 [Desulfobulbaceae bacterium]|nr:hypothetical protein [Desulfobulbaceae bacterium]
MADSMKSLFKRKLYTTYILSSPWLLAAAVALLVFIIATFASHNYRLEKRLMREALEQRAVTLVRVLYSSIRVTLINEIRQHQQLSSTWPEQLQQVVSHISDENDILFISLADANGTVVAHSDQKKIGSQLQSEDPGCNTNDPPIRYQIVTSEGYGHAFIASTAFTVLSQERGGRRMQRMGANGQMMMHRQQGFEHRGPMMGFTIPPEIANQQFQVAVGLDVRGYEQALVRLKWQILLLSVAMLLVGVGGWLSLAAVQGYRVSRETVEKVQAYTALLVAQLPLGVIATTPEGRIETWNGAITALTGCSAREAVGKLPGVVLPAVLAAFFEEPETEGENRSKFAKPVEAAQRLVLTLAGERRVLLCQPLKITDAVQSYRGRVLLLSDITELTDLESRMRENERLAAIGRMAGGVAHEVRNPLSSIKGLAFFLKSKFPGGSREQESADLLVQETERLNRTITEMLDLTRPSQLQLEPVDMAALLRQSLSLMQAELDAHGIVVQLDCDQPLPLIQGDSDRLRQVLMNVLLNAQQAMDEGGELAVRTSTTADQRWLNIQVADTGRGIAPELLPQVFYPYFTTRESGTGIGLAISQKIIMEHKGSIDIQSEPGQGTVVRLRLPLNETAEPDIRAS